MLPITFKEHNKVYAKDQKPYLSLLVYEDDKQGGRVFHCWKLSLWERVRILFIGKLWIQILNFGEPLQPIKPMINSPFTSPKGQNMNLKIRWIKLWNSQKFSDIVSALLGIIIGTTIALLMNYCMYGEIMP